MEKDILWYWRTSPWGADNPVQDTPSATNMPTICTGASIMQSEWQGDYCCSAVRLKFTIKKKKGLFISSLSKLLTVNSSFIDVNVMKLSTAWAFTVILKFSSFLHARGVAIKLTEGELWFVFKTASTPIWAQKGMKGTACWSGIQLYDEKWLCVVT